MSAYEGKTLTVKEFRALGLVQEINRKFLHPLGMALEVIVDADTGEERIERVWDNREDPEGWVFGPGMIDAEKARAIDDEMLKRAHTRINALGFVVQPLPDGEKVQVKDLEVGDRFAWREAVWVLTERSITWVQARNEQFNNVQVFQEHAMSEGSSWFAYVSRMP